MKQKPFIRMVALSAIVILTSAFIFWACNKKQKKEVLHLPDKIIIPYHHADNEDVIGKRLDGSAVIYHFSSGEILIAMKGENEHAATNKFIVQTQKSDSYVTGITKIKKAELIYLFDIILLNNLDKNQLTAYTVNSPTFDETIKNIHQALKKNIKVTTAGYGLGYNKGIWSKLNENLSLDVSIYSLFNTQNRTLNSSGSDCESGGIGSTSCSIRGCFNQRCSVSCATGYYACCYCDTELPDSGPYCLCKSSGSQ